jgi:hypothetical protein
LDEGGKMMHIHMQTYEFAASAGALEGYVYARENIDLRAVVNWVENLSAAYRRLPLDVRDQIQSSCDQTIGRAIRSLQIALSADHAVVLTLKAMVIGPLPESPDDFQKKKWFHD